MASLFCAAPGLSRDQLEPWNVLSRIEILLGQADTLERLQRSKDRERKLAWGMAVTLDCLEAYPDSPLAPLSAALVARAAGRLELASQLLSRAGKLDHDRTCGNRIGYEENLTSSRLFRIQPKKSSLRVWRLLQHYLPKADNSIASSETAMLHQQKVPLELKYCGVFGNELKFT
jgi:hypothetical protein